MPIPTKSTRRHRPSILAKSIGALLAVAALAPGAEAGQIWDGGGANGLWGTGLNWNGDTTPNFAVGLQFDGVLQLLANNDATATVAGLTFNAGAGAFTLSGNAITLNGGILNSSANTQTISFSSITLGSAQIFNASTADLVVTSNVNLSGNTLTVEAGNSTAFNGILTGTGGLIKNGAGTLSLSGLNTYGGTTTVNAGTLQALADGAFSPNSDFTIKGTGVLDLASSNSTIQALNDGGDTTGRVVNTTAIIPGTLTIGNNNASGSFGGTIQAFGSGPLGITKIGTGTQTFSGNNTYTGPTAVNGGTLKAGVASLANFSGAFGNNSPVTLANAAGATLDITGFDTQIGSLTGGGALGGNVTLGAATLTVGGDDTSPAAYGGVISSTGTPATSVIKIGTGSLGFSRNNTYTGDTLLQNGSLFSNVSPGAVTNSAFGTGRLVISGGTTIGSAVNNQTIPNDLSFINPVAPVTIESSTRLTFTGDADLNAGIRTLVGNVHSAELSFNGVIGSTGGVGGLILNTANLVAPIDGTNPYVAFIFAGASTHTYTGLTTVNNGAFLVLNSTGQKISGDVLVQGNGVLDYLNGSNQISDTSTVTINSTGSRISGPTVFQGLDMLSGNSDTIGKLFGTGTVGLGSGHLTVGAGNFTGVITDGTNGVGGRFTKNTAGMLTLAGANVYTGATTVTGGVLEVSGSITSTTINVTGGSFIAANSTAISPAATVTVSTGGGFEYRATANAPLPVGALTLNSGTGTTIGGSIGSSLTGAQITVASAVMPTPGAIRVNVYAVPGVATGAPGTYTLLTAAAGSTLDTGTVYSVGDVFNATNFTVSAVGATPTTITATIIAATPLDDAYWIGGLPGNPSVWSASNGTRSNWASDNTGTPTPLVPGATTEVFFSAGPPAIPTDPGSMTLGANMSIASLTVNAPTAPETRAVTLNDDAFTLTIASARGITINPGAGPVTLNPDMILGASQTWTNNSSNLLTIGGDVSNGANSLTVAGSGNTTLLGVLGNGAGGLTKTGSGVLTITQNNTYTGETRLLGGSLFADAAPGNAGNTALGDGGTLIIAGGTLLGSHVNRQTIQNDLSFINPVGPVTIEAHTSLNFTGNANLNGGTRTLVGTVQASEIAFSGVISNGGVTLDTAGLIPPGDGTTPYVAFIYNGATGHTYTGLTTVNSGAFLVFQGPAQKLLGDVLIQGTGVVDYLGGSDQIADTASVTVNSIGSTITSGAGPTTFAGLELFNRTDTIGSLFGNGTVGLGSGQLTVGAGNFSGVIGDGTLGMGGQLVKNTTGILTLSGANTFTGNTNINNGTLILNGSVQSPTVFVNFSGTLMGTGTAFRNVVNAGILAPGNSTGTFRIAGNYAQTGAGTLAIEIGGTEPGQHDLVAVGGQATLDGTLRLLNVGKVRLKVGDKVTFLTAGGGVTGEFATVDNEFNTGTIVTGAVVYEPNSVSLEGQQGSFQEFAALFRLTPNQRAVASALDDVAADSKQTKLLEFLNAEQLTDLPRDFDLIAPEELASIYTIGTSQANVQTANVQRRLGEIRRGVPDFSAEGLGVSGMVPADSALPPAPTDVVPTPTAAAQGPVGTNGRELRAPAIRNIGTFITGVGEFMRVGQTDNASGYDLASGGFTLGADGRINENLAVGINVGYARSSADLFNNGRVTVDGAKLGAYATYFQENLYLDAAIQGGYNSYDTRRSALQGNATGSTSGGEINALIGGGYDFQGDALRIGPTATLQYTRIGIGSFRETGSLAPLSYDSQAADSLRTQLGMRASYDWRIAGVLVRPELRAAWQHEYGDVAYAIDSRLGSSGNRSAFTVQGAEIGRESLVLGTGVAVLWNERTSAYVYYDGEIGRANYDSHSVSGGMRLQF